MKRLLFLSILGIAVSFIFAPTSFAESDLDSKAGTTFLEILPIDEPHPRIYEVNDLHFGTHDQQEANQQITAKEDLVIQLLDARTNESSWDLQLKVSAFTATKQVNLTQATLELGKGVLKAEDTSGIKESNYQMNSEGYQTILHSDSQHRRGRATYTIPKETIKLSFGENNAPGQYVAINYWRLVNATP